MENASVEFEPRKNDSERRRISILAHDKANEVDIAVLERLVAAEDAAEASDCEPFEEETALLLRTD